MRVCPTCRQQFASGTNFCPYDGRRLDDLVVEAAAAAAAPRDELLGQLLGERYRLESRLGEGGMGVVYGGRHIIIDKPVAVKVLRREYSQDERQAERFLREAKAATRIGHPNIVDITDFGTLPNGQIYFVMEFLVGHTLAWEVRRFGAISAARCIKLGVQICRALSAAHAKGIVHRDLKPENIFIVNPSTVDTAERTTGHPDDTIKLLDFGIAKFAWEADGKRLTRAGSVFGTPQYMAPEQAAGQDADHRLDIYAMGCILYEMLTGELPFIADTFMATLSKHLFDQPTPPRQLKPDLHIRPAIEAVILKAMQKEPDARFQSAAELGAALAACAEQGDLPASDTVPDEEEEPPPPVAPSPPTELVVAPLASQPPLARRGPGLVFWLPLALLVLGAGSFAAWQITRSRSTTPPERKTPEAARLRDAGRKAAAGPVTDPDAGPQPDARAPAVDVRPRQLKIKRPPPKPAIKKKRLCNPGLHDINDKECK